MGESLEELMKHLQIKDNCCAALESILIRDNEVDEEFAKRLLQAPGIYIALERAPDERSTNLALDVLSNCVAKIAFEKEYFLPLLQKAITHKNPLVQEVALKKVLSVLEKNADKEVSDELLGYLFAIFEEYSSNLISVVFKILAISLQTRLSEKVKKSFLKILTMNEVVRCRLYELSVELAKVSIANLNNVEFVLDKAMSELDNDDILLQMNILEILLPLTTSNHTLLYVEKRHLFDVLLTKAEGLHREDNAMTALYYLEILKFFCKVSTALPERVICSYPQVVAHVLDIIAKEDTSTLSVAFDCMGNLLSTDNGKNYMDEKFPMELNKFFSELIPLLRRIPVDVKIRGFLALESIFGTQDESPQELIILLQKWFFALTGGNNISNLMDFVRNPFPEIKMACYKFLKVICGYPWGITSFKNTPGCIEFMLDRSTEFDKEAKYLKYEIIQVLAAARDFFDVQENIKLTTYVSQGPYYIKTATDVAIE